jgi:hypothetical protein
VILQILLYLLISFYTSTRHLFSFSMFHLDFALAHKCFLIFFFQKYIIGSRLTQ